MMFISAGRWSHKMKFDLDVDFSTFPSGKAMYYYYMYSLKHYSVVKPDNHHGHMFERSESF